MTRNLSFLVASVLASAVLAEEQHPRMFITPDRLAAMRKQAAVKDSYHQQIVLLLKSRELDLERVVEELKARHASKG